MSASGPEPRTDEPGRAVGVRRGAKIHPGLDARRKFDARWAAWFDQATDYYEQHGHMPPWSLPVGRWLSRQRQIVRRKINLGTIDQRRKDLLDEHLPGWFSVSDHDDEMWAARLDEAVAFLEQHGRVPPTGPTTLGSWISTQRQAARGRLPYPLDPSRRALLDERLPGWMGAGRRDDPGWAASFEEAVAFYKQHRCFPPWETPLGVWLGHQRAVLRGREQRRGIDPKRRALLDAHLPGWADVSKRDDAGWTASFEVAVAFYKQYGRLPSRSAPGGVWLARQRQAMKGQSRSVMDPRRQALLDEHLPGWLSPPRGRAYGS
ncbi:MAG: helicase associated domain-containing protein [Micrococcales bacterium]|nr:helicase associated domain-containing protein [Micrococcales bacterium]